MSTAMHEGFLEEAARPDLQLIVGGAGQVATAEAVADDSYRYEVSYGEDGRISGAQSWKYEAETDESTFTRFDRDGKVVSRYIKSDALGMSLLYEGDSLVQASHTYNDGKNIETIWYGPNRQPKSSVDIDKAANTHTMTIHQPGIGDWVKTTPYSGLDGWVS